jgi:hypothetical protein
VVCIFPKVLRLAPKDYPQQLTHFFALRKSMTDDYRKQIVSHVPLFFPPCIREGRGGRFAPRVIDLRIPQLAFIDQS